MQWELGALLDMGSKAAAYVPSPKKDKRSQLQATEPRWVMGTMAEVGGCF